MDIVTVQDSFEEVIEEVNNGTSNEDKFWVAIRKSEEEPQKLYTVKVLPGPKFDSDELTFSYHHGIYEASSYKIKTASTIKRIKGVSTVNKMGSSLIMGTKSGELIVYDLDLQQETRIPGCHFLDIVQISVFPSKEVIMTVGLDKQIKLWSIKEWRNIRTFTCLNSSNIELIGRGRNFLNGNANGELNLWECGSGQVVHKFIKIKNKNDEILRMKLINTKYEEGENELEFETNDKLVVVNYASGDTIKFNVFTKGFERIDLKVQMASLDFFENHLIIGTTDGKLIIYDLISKTAKFERQFNHRELLLIHNGKTIFAYNGEETLFMMRFDFKTFNITDTIYLAGLPEFFKVESMEYIDGHLLVASDYGVALYRV